MSWGAVSEEGWAGEIRFAPESTKTTFISQAAAEGRLLVELGPPRSAVRGRLSLYIEGAIERCLEARGAPPPSPPRPYDRDGALRDQIHRLRVSGAAGLSLWFSSLEDIAGPAKTLDADDSAALLWWLRAATDLPVSLAFDAANREIGVYMEPRTLESILAEAARPEPGTAVGADGADDSDAGGADAPAVMDSDPAATDDAGDDAGDDESTTTPPDLAESARAMAAELGDDGDVGWLRDALMELSTPPPRPVSVARAAEPASEEPDADEGTLDDESIPPPPLAPRLDLRFADASPAPAVRPAPRAEIDLDQRRKLEACVRELDAASGPKPLSVVERLFQNAYVPLRAALDRGVDLGIAAREIADEWARGFEKSYVEGFDALRVRTKRPTMVVDVPDIALRVGRLHGARSTQLLLVDALRFDLGEAVNERLRALAGQRAACAERLLLWSALPTATATQLDLLGRGPAGLRDTSSPPGDDMLVARGRKAQMLRRVKAGPRELLKLDVVAAHISEPGGADATSFDALADEVAARLAAHFEGLQPRTLVMVFGDHGFSLDGQTGHPSVREGGASPEEVLVPAYAWLVGAVH